MERTLLPPEFVSVEPIWFYGLHEIPVPTKFFYLQIRGLAWGRDCTPWLTIDELEQLTGKKASVIWGYMSALRTSHCLLWQTAKGRGFMFTFTEPENYSEKSELLRKIGNASSSTSLINNDINLNKKEEEAAPKNRSTPKNRSELPASPKQAAEHPDMRVFLLASNNTFPVQSQYKVVIETIQLLRERYGLSDAELGLKLKRYFLAWVGRVRKDGTAYRKDAITWLTEWAVNENIPAARVEKVSNAEVSQADYEAKKAEARARMQVARQLGGTIT